MKTSAATHHSCTLGKHSARHASFSGAVFQKTREGRGAFNRWGCRRKSVSLFCWERKRERERISLPTFPQCDHQRLFILPAVMKKWAPFLSSWRNLFSVSIKGLKEKGRRHETLLFSVFDKSCTLQVFFNTAAIIAGAEIRDYVTCTHTQSLLRAALAENWTPVKSEHMAGDTKTFREPEETRCQIQGWN